MKKKNFKQIEKKYPSIYKITKEEIIFVRNIKEGNYGDLNKFLLNQKLIEDIELSNFNKEYGIIKIQTNLILKTNTGTVPSILEQVEFTWNDLMQVLTNGKDFNTKKIVYKDVVDVIKTKSLKELFYELLKKSQQKTKKSKLIENAQKEQIKRRIGNIQEVSQKNPGRLDSKSNFNKKLFNISLKGDKENVRCTNIGKTFSHLEKINKQIVICTSIYDNESPSTFNFQNNKRKKDLEKLVKELNENPIEISRLLLKSFNLLPDDYTIELYANKNKLIAGMQKYISLIEFRQRFDIINQEIKLIKINKRGLVFQILVTLINKENDNILEKKSEIGFRIKSKSQFLFGWESTVNYIKNYSDIIMTKNYTKEEKEFFELVKSH